MLCFPVYAASHHRRFLSVGYSLPTAHCALTSLESADPQNPPVTPLQTTEPKTKDLKSCGIRRSEKRGGWGVLLLTTPSQRGNNPVCRKLFSVGREGTGRSACATKLIVRGAASLGRRGGRAVPDRLPRGWRSRLW